MLFYQNLSKPKTIEIPIHGRASWSANEDERVRVGVEWDLFATRFALQLEVGEPEHDAMIHVGIPLLADLYVHGSAPWLRKLNEVVISQPSDLGNRYSGRTTGLRIFDVAIWWELWVDPGGWNSKRPKWRSGSFHVLDELLGRRKLTDHVLEERPITIHMPEGSYAGVCALKEGVWKRPRWPWPQRLVRAHITMTQPVPIPGKGESDYDLDQDAVFSSTFPANSIDEAVKKETESILRTRRSRAGDAWRPEVKAPSVSS